MTIDRRQLLLGLAVGFGPAALICAALSGDLPSLAEAVSGPLGGLLGGVVGAVIAHRALDRRAAAEARAAYARTRAAAAKAARELGAFTGPYYEPMRER